MKGNENDILYRIDFCSSVSYQSTGHKIPDDGDETAVWTIHSTTSLITVHYFDKAIIHIPFDELRSSYCKEKLKTQKGIKFSTIDLMSRYYRPKPTGILKLDWTLILYFKLLLVKCLIPTSIKRVHRIYVNMANDTDMRQ